MEISALPQSMRHISLECSTTLGRTTRSTRVFKNIHDLTDFSLRNLESNKRDPVAN
jgi:hypothetical protein